MNDYWLPGYEINKETWFYHSLLLCIAVYFKFGRTWSIRNLDLLLILCVSPGLIAVRRNEALGYSWLLLGTGVLLVRCLFDWSFQRRPRLEQNLNTSGLAFLAVATLGFLVANVWSEELPTSTRQTVTRGEDLIDRTDTKEEEGPDAGGPTSSLVAAPAVGISRTVAMQNVGTDTAALAARILATLAHLFVVLGLICVARWHFGDLHLGLSMAVLYLLLPCTAYDVQKVNHVLPAALIVWAVAAYRRPLASGSLLGFACGTLLFPVFLLPLWASFYGRYGAIRFLGAVGVIATALVLTVVLYSADHESFYRQSFGGFDLAVVDFQNWHEDFGGLWSEQNYLYRLPVFSLYLLMIVALTIWPRKKNLEHLIAMSAAVILGSQFWYPWGGGAYMLWYVPLILLVMFRPRLSHLIAPWRAVSSTRRSAVNAPREQRVGSLSSGPSGDLF